jgi:hypothetical protein
MKKFTVRFAVLAALIVLAETCFAQNPEDQISVVGTDGIQFVSTSIFQGGLKRAIEFVVDSIFPVLKKHSVPESKPWGLQTIGVGIGASAQAGLGPLWNITATPRVRLIFTRGANPVYPD